jgi:cGMP-dependent protein kinase
MGSGISRDKSSSSLIGTKAKKQKIEPLVIEEEKGGSCLRDEKKDSGSVNNKGVSEKRNGRIQLFEKVELRREGSLQAMLQDNGLSEAPETEALLLSSMKNFLFLEQDLADDSKLNALLKAFQREEFDADETIITEGESGSKLYILEHGQVEVFINGDYIRTMGRGTIFGELALLYDAPRSATVRCKAVDDKKIVLWSLSRDVFKQVQIESSSAVQTQRARWFINSPDLAVLGAIELSRLVATLHHQKYPAGSKLYSDGTPSMDCIVIERGVVAIYASEDVEAMSPQEIDKVLGIVRPRGTPQFFKGKNPSIISTVTQADGDAIPSNLQRARSSRREIAAGRSGSGAGVKTIQGRHVCDVSVGFILGIDILRSRAGLPNTWKWTPTGAKVPFTAVATTDVQCLTFTVDVFERLFGSVERVFKLEKNFSILTVESVVQEAIFDPAKFKIKYVLGSGSFGTVTLAEYRDGSPTPKAYALKSLSKAGIVETGQVRHIVDERKLLSSMHNRFILKLYGAYQTPHQLIMVTEVLECGDLWSVIYERPNNPDKGLAPDLVQFYTGILVLGLSHIHEKGIAFRDLKPENVMVDNSGYLRIIDFGFGKKIPFTTTEWNGETKVHAKSFTLCGTPGEREV